VLAFGLAFVRSFKKDCFRMGHLRDSPPPDSSSIELSEALGSSIEKSRRRTTQVKVLLNSEELRCLDAIVETAGTDRATVFRNLLAARQRYQSTPINIEKSALNSLPKPSLGTIFFEFKSYSEGLAAIECMKSGQTIVCSVGSLEPELAQRIIAFLAGATSLANGTAERINNSVFLFASSSGVLGLYDNKQETVIPCVGTDVRLLTDSYPSNLKLPQGIKNRDPVLSHNVVSNNRLEDSPENTCLTFQSFFESALDHYLSQLGENQLNLLRGIADAYDFSSHSQSLALLLQSIFLDNDLSIDTLSKKSESLNSVSFEPLVHQDSGVIDCVMRGEDLFPAVLIEKLDAFMHDKKLDSPSDAIGCIFQSLV
jgi:hypothetical protein